MLDQHLIEDFNILRQNENKNLNDLKDLLDRTLYIDGDFNDRTFEFEYGKKLNTVVNLIGLKDNFQWLIEQLVNDQQSIMNLTKNSYRHNNGFDKIVLMNGLHGWKLRLHIWWSDSYVSFQEDIHDHSWMFASKVLFGQIHCDVFEDANQNSADSELFKEYQYTSPSKSTDSQSAYTVEYVKDTYLKKSESNVIIKFGQSYIFPTSMMHRILQPTLNDLQTKNNYGSITLAITAPRVRLTSRLINTIDTDYQQEQALGKMSPNEIVQKLKSISHYTQNYSHEKLTPLLSSDVELQNFEKSL